MAALHRVTPKKKAEFLDALAQTGNVRQAAKAVGVSANRFYVHRRQDPLFAQKWEETIQQAMDTVLEPEAIRRAVEGVEKAVYYRGAQVGVEREYSDTLLIFLLKGWKSDRYTERREVFHRPAVALLRQLVKDTQSRRPTIQEEARAFLAGEGLRFWADLLGTDCAQLTQAVHRHLQESFIQR